ncbi:MAG: hypothetical protein IT425_11030 [Pirellulales bacterium]|nr:hypothetical protein [Pirellulales bacterium]
MMWYVAIIALVNLGLGYALGHYLGFAQKAAPHGPELSDDEAAHGSPRG